MSKLKKIGLNMLLILLTISIAAPSDFGNCFSFADASVEKYFDQMTQEEKTGVLNDLISKKVVPNTVKVDGKSYSLNIINWNTRGVITYGEVAVVNAANQTTSFSNYKDGEWRYLGYDMNGGLYGNDDFPPDYTSSPTPQSQTWLTKMQIAFNDPAKNLIGGTNNINADAKHGHADKEYTASVFLSQNPKWVVAGWTTSKICEHFFFNAVLSDNGLTQGQFVGVKDIGGGVLRYQTFSVKVTVKFAIPPPTQPDPEPVLPVDPEPEPENPVVPPLTPEIDVTVNCELGLPEVTYASHPTLAEDHSLFSVGEDIWSAQQAYSQGLASNKFRATNGSVKKITNARAEITFDTPGHYFVELEVTPKEGKAATDTKSIEVKPTPTIMHTLTGTQKQNRKQVLNLKVAKRPGSELTNFWIRIDYFDKDESVTLHHKATGENVLVNSEHIKTRAIERLSTSDMYYECCKLEFLLKNTAPANCRYTVFVKDSRGNTDQVSFDFSVSNDKPPEADIFLEGAYLRGANSNTAEIIAEDISITDGDQLDRSWFYRATDKEPEDGEGGPWLPITTSTADYRDYSFGSGKKIGFSKDGVGKFEVKMIAEDIWAEETLPEYVDDSDRLSAETTATSSVINMAPVVSLKPMATQSADITILTGGNVEYRKARENQARIETALLEEGIDARVTIEKMMPSEVSNGPNAADKVFEVATPLGHEGAWTFYEDKNFIVDNEKLCKVSATWPDYGYSTNPVSPYTVNAWDISTGQEAWSYTFSDSLMQLPINTNNIVLAQDDTGEYLFITASGKTLIITKDNGSFLAALDIEIGRSNFVEGNNIYTIKSDGIYRISASNGQITKIYSANVLEPPADTDLRNYDSARRLEGVVHFVTCNKNTMHRVLFDPETEKITIEPLPIQDYGLGRTTHSLAGIDISGKLMIQTSFHRLISDGEYYSYRTSHARVYDRNNALIYTSPDHPHDRSGSFTPVYNDEGVCNYLASAYSRKSGSYYYIHAYLYGIYDGSTTMHEIRNKSDYPSDENKIPFAKELNGEVFIATGAYWVYVQGSGTGIYRERLKVFAFNSSTKGVREADYTEIGAPNVTTEYGYDSDVYTAYQTGNNWPNLGNGSETCVVAWDQSLDKIINRYVSKYFRGIKDINALVIFDETNDPSSYTPSVISSLSEKAESVNGKVIISSRSEIEGDVLINDIITVSGEDTNLLSINVPDQGSISKKYTFDPDKTYYYEYEIRTIGNSSPTEDILSVNHGFIDPQNSIFDPSGYKVVDSYYEDFEGPNTNPFFTLLPDAISEGYYKGASIKDKLSSNYYREDPYPLDKTKLTFTVPEGKYAYLSFDYLLERESLDSLMQSYVKIDDELWKFSYNQSKSGIYRHPQLLGPGEHSLLFFTSDYDTIVYGTMWLDSLSVDILEYSSDLAPLVFGNEPLSSNSTSSGYTKITGTFKTPYRASTYGNVQNAEVINGEIASASYMETRSSAQDSLSYRFKIPDGKSAINTSILLKSKSSSSHNVSYTFKGTYDISLTCRYSTSDHNIALNIPDLYDFRPGILDGRQDISLSTRANNGSRGDFMNFSAILVDSSNTGWCGLNNFLEVDGDTSNFYLENNLYSDTTVSFNFLKGEYEIKNFNIYSIEDGIRLYKERESFSDSSKFSLWSVGNASAAITKAPAADNTEDNSLIYRKNELVAYNIHYFDYEGDPSKREYWKYTHLPFNDGPHPDAAVIINDDNEPVTITGKVLDAPIKRFNVDGKYIVEHWQEDNTSRPAIAAGNPDYDKLSNVESIVFYVQGGGGSAPWIKSIKTVPRPVKENDAFKIQVEIDDKDKDALQLITEVYLDSEIIYRHKKTDIEADSKGVYPAVITGNIPSLATAGRYEAVCTVRDSSGVGVDSYRFTVVSEGKISGRIGHTDEWDQNRKKYNIAYFGEEFNQRSSYEAYLASRIPRKRGINVFWSGERFMLTADVAGDPLKVTAEIVGVPACKTILINTGNKNALGEAIYKGQLWNNNMINRWGKTKPQQLAFRFTAEYEGGINKTFEDSIIVDSSIDYWLLHRVW